MVMDMDMDTSYSVPTALTVLAGVFLIIGAICAITVTVDIIWRKGWRSMMGIMIPVWIINATYMGPITLYLYFRFGRPSHPSSGQTAPSCHQEKKDTTIPGNLSCHQQEQNKEAPTEHACHQRARKDHVPPTPACHKDASRSPASDAHCAHHAQEPASDHSSITSPNLEKQVDLSPPTADDPHTSHHAASSRPMWATVASGVSHCGAGCVLGDLVGEWLVYGTGATISGETLWPALLIDYAFALLFGIVFQYFSIAPMSGAYGPKTVWRAAKADILSLTSFEVGAFGWMTIYQAGIWGYRLSMTTWTYWWMMQMGMIGGFATAYPVNWWLLRKGIKEACC